MSEIKHPEVEFEPDDFDLGTLEDELRVDDRCQSLLKHFYLYLQSCGKSPQQASDFAYSADFYLRDYLVDFARKNVVRPQKGDVRRFAATWFITRTLDPDMTVLQHHLEGIRELYRFLSAHHLIALDELAFIEEEAGQIEYYRQRIESFHNITGDGYCSWEAECPLKG